MKPILAIAMLSFTIIAGCKKNDDSTNGVPEITGINLKDELGTSQGTKGSPNGNSGTDSDPRLRIYPNPCKGSFDAYLRPQTNVDSVTFWMEAGHYKNAPKEAEIKNNDYWKNPGKRLLERKVAIPGGTRTIRLNVADYPSGFYRVYLKADNTIYWEDLWITN